MANQEDDQHAQIPSHCAECYDPGQRAEEGIAQQVLAGVEVIRLWGALDGGTAQAVQFHVRILEGDVIDSIQTIVCGFPME